MTQQLRPTSWPAPSISIHSLSSPIGDDASCPLVDMVRDKNVEALLVALKKSLLLLSSTYVLTTVGAAHDASICARE